MKLKTWYNEIGFFNNPFSIKPASFHDELFGYEGFIKEINNKIRIGTVIFIGGEYGAGKTTVLKRIINRFKGKKRVIYYSCNEEDKDIPLDSLLYNKNFFTRIFRIKPRNMILLLDEAQDMNKKDAKKLVEYYKEGYFKSILLVSFKQSDVKFTKELKDLLDDNIFKFGKLNKKNAVELVRKRIGSIKLLKDEIIEKIHSINPNPRAFLKNLEDICRYTVENNATEVTLKHIKEAL